jgi:hypothetical protein
MRTPSGKLAENDSENMEALTPHFEKIFNGQSPNVNMQSTLDDIEQRPMFHELGLPPLSKKSKQASRTWQTTKH